MYPRTNTGGLDSLSPVIEVIRNSFVDGSLGFLGSSEACGSSEGSSGFVGDVCSSRAGSTSYQAVPVRAGGQCVRH